MSGDFGDWNNSAKADGKAAGKAAGKGASHESIRSPAPPTRDEWDAIRAVERKGRRDRALTAIAVAAIIILTALTIHWIVTQ